MELASKVKYQIVYSHDWNSSFFQVHMQMIPIWIGFKEAINNLTGF
uniref:Uncharacterized protein n=1 Tax=uncultured Desulfobacterium sp. TaxID=201089 RepID=E1YGH7_9BACT|nr:unknown protein [uncultured Desulfobacterium sp.]